MCVVFDQILVPIDQSLLAESILPHVISVSQVFKSRVVLMHVLDSIQGAVSNQPTDPFDWQIQRSGAQAYLKDIATAWMNLG
jgi:nucleotide-binding universal stress UspA family protein